MSDERIRAIVPGRVPRWVHASGLMFAAVGMLVQFMTGVPGFPPVPPGPILLAVAGLAAAVFITVGAVASGETVRLLSSGAPWGQLTGIGMQLLGALVALVAGVVAITRAALGHETTA